MCKDIVGIFSYRIGIRISYFPSFSGIELRSDDICHLLSYNSAAEFFCIAAFDSFSFADLNDLLLTINGELNVVVRILVLFVDRKPEVDTDITCKA